MPTLQVLPRGKSKLEEMMPLFQMLMSMQQLGTQGKQMGLAREKFEFGKDTDLANAAFKVIEMLPANERVAALQNLPKVYRDAIFKTQMGGEQLPGETSPFGGAELIEPSTRKMLEQSLLGIKANISKLGGQLTLKKDLPLPKQVSTAQQLLNRFTSGIATEERDYTKAKRERETVLEKRADVKYGERALAAQAPTKGDRENIEGIKYAIRTGIPTYVYGKEFMDPRHLRIDNISDFFATIQEMGLSPAHFVEEIVMLSSKRVDMISPEGETKSIPNTQVEQALQEGWSMPK